MQCRLPQKIVIPKGPWITIVISGAENNSAVQNYVAEYSSQSGVNNTTHLGDKTIKASLSRLDRFKVSVGSRYGYRATINRKVYKESSGSHGDSMSSVFFGLLSEIKNLTFSTITITFEYTNDTVYAARVNIVTS